MSLKESVISESNRWSLVVSELSPMNGDVFQFSNGVTYFIVQK